MLLCKTATVLRLRIFNRLYGPRRRYCFPSILFYPRFKVLNYVIDFVSSRDTKTRIPKLDFSRRVPPFRLARFLEAMGFPAPQGRILSTFDSRALPFGVILVQRSGYFFDGLGEDLFSDTDLLVGGNPPRK